MVFLPSLSFHVKSCKLESELMGRVASQTSPFTLAERTFLASPSLIDCAICNAEVPFSYSRTAPSGRVIFIINCFGPAYNAGLFVMKQR